ncbi:hypothetical protein AAMO2058_000842200 [Amorphochlora amoebiformis]
MIRLARHRSARVSPRRLRLLYTLGGGKGVSRAAIERCLGKRGGAWRRLNYSTTSGGVTVINSLSGDRREIRPQPSNGLVTWYACGPTVYDEAHIGHARTYVTFDILLRILVDVFGYELEYAMGVTDIDDKIIKRAKESKEHPLNLARRFEYSFFEDMKSLNVRPPAIRLRVTEHIPRIIEYINKIVQKGYAYHGENGDVYFDVSAYESEGNFSYSQFRELQEAHTWSGGGEQGNESTGKRGNADFALWKGFKQGIDHDGYSWDAPWGRGRPGWHIECSAMATDLFGDHNLTVHSGGVDLQFPHHNNEIAQCCAHSGPEGSWKDTIWLHTGHLHIQGLKMSKSLKNFITIKNFLADYSADELRIYCLQHHYASKVDFTADGLLAARAVLKKFKELKARIEYISKQSSGFSENVLEVSELSGEFSNLKLERALLATRKRVRSSLADNFDTPTALSALLSLATTAQRHLDETRQEMPLSIDALQNVWEYISATFTNLGVIEFSRTGGLAMKETKADRGGADDLVESIASCRARVRGALKGENLDSDRMQKVLSWTDKARDDILPLLERKLKDLPDGSYRIDKWTAKQQKQELGKSLRMKESQKEREKALQEEKKFITTTPPEQLFRRETDKYSKFDDQGLPTHDASGEEISKNARKKLAKIFKRHKEKYDKITTSGL